MACLGRHNTQSSNKRHQNRIVTQRSFLEFYSYILTLPSWALSGMTMKIKLFGPNRCEYVKSPEYEGEEEDGDDNDEDAITNNDIIKPTRMFLTLIGYN